MKLTKKIKLFISCNAKSDVIKDYCEENKLIIKSIERVLNDLGYQYLIADESDVKHLDKYEREVSKEVMEKRK